MPSAQPAVFSWEIMETKHSAAIYTLGCRVNQYESEALGSRLESLGFVMRGFDEKCDVYIVNTCAVTGESERKSRQIIRRAHTENPDAHIIVMGCYSQLKAESVLKMQGVKYVCGNRNKLRAADVALKLCSGEKAGGISLCDVETAPIECMTIRKSDHTRAYVKIEDGCDNRCTYCIIKTARGNVVSRKISDIIEEVNGLADVGYREIVLTGIETASFGKDTKEKLSDLIKAVAENEKIERIRLGSFEPSALNKSFIDEISGITKFMPSFHLSLQSGSSAVLARMKRKYNIDQVLSNVGYIREKIPGVTFTCDVIVGFPGETEEEFGDTVKASEKIGFLHMHIFPYSAREGTPAAEMPDQVPQEIKHIRAARLKKTGESLAAAVYGSVKKGSVKRVLFETPEGDVQLGHTPEMMEVRVANKESLQGQIFDVRITGTSHGVLTGDLV